MKYTPKLEAFFYNINSGNQMSNDRKIYLMLKERPMTIEQLRNFKVPHQTLTSCLCRLEKLGLIYKKSNVKGAKHTFTLWDVSKTIKECEQRQITIFERDYMRWKKLGEREGYFELL